MDGSVLSEPNFEARTSTWLARMFTPRESRGNPRPVPEDLSGSILVVHIRTE